MQTGRLVPRIALLCAWLAVLTACGTTGKTTAAQEIQSYYASLESLSFTALLRTDYRDSIIDFGLEIAAQKEMVSLVVTGPPLLAGIRAVTDGDGITLSYDGFVLETGELPGTGLSPMELLPYMLRQWKRGYVTELGREELAGVVCHRITFSRDGLLLVTWFNADGFAPVQCELITDGFTAARLTVSGFAAVP